MKHCPIVCGQSKEGVKTQKRNPPTRLPTHGTQRRPFRGLLSPRDIPWEQESRTWRSVLKFSRQIGQAPDESPLRSDANRTSDHSPDHVAWLGEGRSRRGDYDQPNPRRSAATTTHSDAPQSCTPPHPTHTTHTDEQTFRKRLLRRVNQAHALRHRQRRLPGGKMGVAVVARLFLHKQPVEVPPAVTLRGLFCCQESVSGAQPERR